MNQPLQGGLQDCKVKSADCKVIARCPATPLQSENINDFDYCKALQGVCKAVCKGRSGFPLRGTPDLAGNRHLATRHLEALKMSDTTMNTNTSNSGLNPRRWQPRPALRDDLPLFDERVIPVDVPRKGVESPRTGGADGYTRHRFLLEIFIERVSGAQISTRHRCGDE